MQAVNRDVWLERLGRACASHHKGVSMHVGKHTASVSASSALALYACYSVICFLCEQR